MALTIRTLSKQAETTIENIIKNNEHINTSTKAIEFVLEYFPVKCDALREKERENLKLEEELSNAINKLDVISNGFSVITEMIAKS